MSWSAQPRPPPQLREGVWFWDPQVSSKSAWAVYYGVNPHLRCLSGDIELTRSSNKWPWLLCPASPLPICPVYLESIASSTSKFNDEISEPLTWLASSGPVPRHGRSHWSCLIFRGFLLLQGEFRDGFVVRRSMSMFTAGKHEHISPIVSSAIL